MTDEIPDIPLPPRYEPPRPEPATARPGHAAPRVQAADAEWERIRREDLTIDDAIKVARSVVRLSPNPLNDAAWPHVRPALEEAIAALSRRDDPASLRKLEICRTLHRGKRA